MLFSFVNDQRVKIDPLFRIAMYGVTLVNLFTSDRHPLKPFASINHMPTGSKESERGRRKYINEGPLQEEEEEKKKNEDFTNTSAQ